MYNIAICDDERKDIQIVISYLENYQKNNPKFSYTLTMHTSLKSLLNEIERNGKIDLIFLDIYLKDGIGMDIAKKLKENNQDYSIIFVTSSLEYGVEAFEVDAIQYLLKPIAQNKFNRALEKAINKIKEEKKYSVILNINGIPTKIMLKDIIYAEADGNYQYLFINKEEPQKLRITLSELKELLKPYSNFASVGRAYIINFNYVEKITPKGIVLENQKTIFFPRGKYQELKDLYFQYYFNRN